MCNTSQPKTAPAVAQVPKVIAHIRHDKLGHPYAAMHSAYDEQGDGLKEGAELILASSAMLAAFPEAPAQAETPDENNQWIAEAKKTLDHLAGFLYRIGAPHKVNWRDWIDSAEKHLASQQAVKGEPLNLLHKE